MARRPDSLSGISPSTPTAGNVFPDLTACQVLLHPSVPSGHGDSRRQNKAAAFEVTAEGIRVGSQKHALRRRVPSHHGTGDPSSRSGARISMSGVGAKAARGRLIRGGTNLMRRLA